MSDRVSQLESQLLGDGCEECHLLGMGDEVVRLTGCGQFETSKFPMKGVLWWDCRIRANLSPPNPNCVMWLITL